MRLLTTLFVIKRAFPIYHQICLIALLSITHLNAQTISEITQQTEAAWELFPDNAEEAERIGHLALEQAFQMELKHDSVIAKCYQLIGVANYFQSKLYTAGNYFQKALKTQCGQEKSKLSAAFWNNLGIIYDHQDRLKEAIHAYNQALDISLHLADTNGMMQRWINISLLENKIGNQHQAISLVSKALEYVVRRNDSSRIAFCHQNLGIFLDQLGNLKEANEHHLQAYALYEQLGDQYHLASLLLNRATSEQKRGNITVSNQLLEQAIIISRTHQLENLLASMLVQKATNSIRQGTSLEQAAKDLEEAYLLYQKTGRTDKIAAFFEVKSRVFAKLGQFASFQIALDSFVAITARTTNNNALATYQELQALYELDRKTQSIQQLESDVRARNLQLTLLATLLLSSALGAGAVIYQHLRLKRYVKSLFQLNSDQATQPALVVNAKPFKESEAQLFELYERILRQMESEKWFLDPQLGLHEISSKMESNQTYVSQAINMYSGTNLAGFVNRFRINEARRILLSSAQKFSMMEVAQQVGYTNRVSFYRQFKELTGFSPTEFMELAKHTAADSYHQHL